MLLSRCAWFQLNSIPRGLVSCEDLNLMTIDDDVGRGEILRHRTREREWERMGEEEEG